MMMMRVAFLCMVLLSVSWVCAAREVGENQFAFPVDFTERRAAISDEISGNKEQEKETLVSKELIKNQQICTLCEEFAGQALEYMLSNKTQDEIVQILHKSCSRLHTFKQECVTLVDYYAPLFFKQISLVEPQDFCHKINLCEKIALFSSQLQKASCTICHHTISDILVKLKDPDTQLEIIQLLLKLCKSLDNNARKCKQLVFEFGPIILTNAEQFLERTDICALLHACTPSREEGLQVLKADS